MPGRHSTKITYNDYKREQMQRSTAVCSLFILVKAYKDATCTLDEYVVWVPQKG